MFNNAVAPRDQFIAAVSRNNLPEIVHLLKSGVSPNIIIDKRRLWTAVDIAQAEENDELLALLIAHGGKLKPIQHARSSSSALDNANSSKRAAKSMDALDGFSSQSQARLGGVSSGSSSTNQAESKRDQFIKVVKSNLIDELSKIIPNLGNTNFFIDEEKNTALHHACKTRNKRMAELLVSSNSTRIDLKNKANKTPVDIAIDSENSEILNALKNHKDFQRLVTNYFIDAISRKDRQKVIFLSNQFDFLELSKLDLALDDQDFDYFKELISKGSKPTYNHVKQALMINDVRFIELIAKQEGGLNLIDPDTQENILIVLARQNKWNGVHAVVKVRPTNALDPYGYTNLLLLALVQRNELMVRALLDAKTPLTCLYGEEGQKLLKAIRDERTKGLAAPLVSAGNEERAKGDVASLITDHLIKAAASDPQLTTYINTNLAKIPEGLQDYFIDSLSAAQFDDVVITPHGTSYDRNILRECLEQDARDPETREPLQVNSLLPNRVVTELI